MKFALVMIQAGFGPKVRISWDRENPKGIQATAATRRSNQGEDIQPAMLPEVILYQDGTTDIATFPMFWFRETAGKVGANAARVGILLIDICKETPAFYILTGRVGGDS